MANCVENDNDISCDTGQGKTDWHVWWSTISVLTLDRIKMMAVSMENYITSDTGKDKTDWHSVWWITISVLTQEKIKINCS